MSLIYLDYNATTPIDQRVMEAMRPYLEQHFGNPSSSHAFGIRTRQAVETARQQVARLFGCRPEEIVFTSGGSESNNFAIKGAAFANRDKGNHIITTAIEHPAVTEVCRYLENQGYKITYLPVDEFGLVDAQQVEEAITPETILVSVMHANNEVGTIQPIEKIAEITQRYHILLHSDCAQSIGKIPVRVDEMPVDLLSVAGHKFYAPKGIGALYIRTGTKLEKLIHGADHEMNRRAGTENVIGIVGLGKACELVGQNLNKSQQHLKRMRERLEKGLLEKFPEARRNGHPDKRLPNTLSISFPNLEANTILAELTGVAASAGAACHSDQVDVSHVLEAMGIPLEYAMGTIRFSVGRFTTAAEIDKALLEIIRVVQNLQPRETPVFLDTSSATIKLTQYTHGLGCACKLRPQVLEEVLKKLPLPEDPDILVGTETADDAAVYRIDAQSAIVQTVDFFTPVVDDPFDFGAIAAANSLSDIYAMGARPLFALNIVGFPSNRLPVTVLEAILKGAQAKAEEAGIAIIGGHTVDDTEPKFGLAVTGVVHPDRILTNRTARPDDVLVLTKPLGTGVLSTALKRGALDQKTGQAAVKTMATLNRTAAEAMQEVGVHSCTDVTGFGLLGHLLEMIQGARCAAVIFSEKVPFLPEVQRLTIANMIPGGTRDNYAFTAPSVEYRSSVSEMMKLMLNDAQTSGGLLIALPEDRAEKLLDLLRERGVKEAAVVGRILKQAQVRIFVE